MPGRQNEPQPVGVPKKWPKPRRVGQASLGSRISALK
jgi:hypothetical protein